MEALAKLEKEMMSNRLGETVFYQDIKIAFAEDVMACVVRAEKLRMILRERHAARNRIPELARLER
jgi:hypothetical protein